MASENENEFLNQWREVFDKAEMQPPDNLWSRIEGELDKEEKKAVFIWWKNPFLVSGIAASLLLVLSWVVVKNQEATIQISANEAPMAATMKTLPSVNVLPETSSKTNETSKITENRNNLAILSEKTKPTKSKIESDKLIVNKEYSTPITNRKSEEGDGFVGQEVSQKGLKTQSTEPLITQNVVTDLSDATYSRQENGTIDKIKAIDFEPYNSRFTLNRKKLLVELPIQEEEEILAKNDQSVWFGVQSGIAPFNPNFQAGGFSSLAMSESKKFTSDNSNYEVQVEPPTSINGGVVEMPNNDKTFNVTSSQPIQRFNTGRAVNLGFRVGKQLTKRIAFESGLRYLQGTSTFNTNVYSFNDQSGEVKSFFANYLTPNINLNNTIITSEQQLSNNYDYLMLPLQLVYQIPIANKFQADIVAGFSTDILLANSIAGVKTNLHLSDDTKSLYRNFNVSSLAGARLNYLFKPRWQITLGGNWQRAAFSTLKPNSANISIRPNNIGLIYGLNYRF